MSDELDRTLAEAALTPSKTALRAAAIAAALGTVIKYRTSSTASETLHGVTHSTTTEGANIPGLLGSGIAIVVALVGITLAVRAKPMDPDASAEERAALSKAGSIAMGLGVLIVLYAAWILFNALPRTVTT